MESAVPSPQRVEVVPVFRLRLPYTERLQAAKAIKSLAEQQQTTYYDRLLTGLCYWEAWHKGSYLSVVVCHAQRNQELSQWLHYVLKEQTESYERDPAYWWREYSLGLSRLRDDLRRCTPPSEPRSIWSASAAPG